MACHHHLCLPCASSRLEGDGMVKCPCTVTTKLTAEAYNVIIEQNCHSRAACNELGCGKKSPYNSPRKNPQAGIRGHVMGEPGDQYNNKDCACSPRNLQGQPRQDVARKAASLRWCPLHPDETLNFWCVDCRVFICPECGMVGQHYGHNFRTLRQQASEVQQSLHSSIAALNAFAREAGREFEKIDSQSRGVEMMLNNSKKTLRKQVQRIIRDLELYQENMERAYTHASEQCFSVLTRACDAAVRAEENYRMHADDIAVAISSEEAELVEWYGKTKDTIDKLSREPPRFLDSWPYIETTPAELCILWDGEPLLSTKVPKLVSKDIPDPNLSLMTRSNVQRSASPQRGGYVG